MTGRMIVTRMDHGRIRTSSNCYADLGWSNSPRLLAGEHDPVANAANTAALC